MGWTYRRSMRFGPVRVSAGRGGVGYSLGGGGFRTGLSARGRRYTSVTLPGTGWRYATGTRRRARGCAALLALGALGAGATGTWAALCW